MSSGKRILGDGSDFPRVDPGLTERLIKEYGEGYVPPAKADDDNTGKTEDKPNASLEDAAESGLVDSGNFWRVDGVQYRNGIYTADLAKTLLEGGNARTQDAWAEHCESVPEFHAPDYPLFYGIAKALSFGGNTAEIAEAQKFLMDTSRAKWLMTLTRVKYLPHDQDVIIHNYGTKNKYEERVNFVGPDEWIKDTQNPEAYQKLLGTSDSIQEINNVFQWLNGTDAYLWRVNNKPKKVNERVARFGADSFRAYLSCYRYPTDSDPSLGVRAVRRHAQKN